MGKIHLTGVHPRTVQVRVFLRDGYAGGGNREELPDQVLINKGLALFRRGKIPDAIECYNKALEINPACAGAWSNKGTSLGYPGKNEEYLAF